jgi:uncharacterized protein DUF6970
LVFIRYAILLTMAVALGACGADAPGAGPASSTPLPAAITELIHEIQGQAPASPPSYVASYEYEGKVVYYVPPRCCDIFGDLYDEAGQLICHPDGGLTRTGDGRCPDFASKRVNEKIIWRDLRPRS